MGYVLTHPSCDGCCNWLSGALSWSSLNSSA
jgi:hypothetical protein